MSFTRCFAGGSMMDLGEMLQRCPAAQFADADRRRRHPAFVRIGPMQPFSQPVGTVGHPPAGPAGRPAGDWAFVT